MKFSWHTALDIEGREIFPTDLPEIPRVGDLIESGHVWPGPRVLVLEVVRVTWKPFPAMTEIDHAGNTYYLPGGAKKWQADVELHLPKNQWESVKAFFEWYGGVTGRGTSAYI